MKPDVLDLWCINNLRSTLYRVTHKEWDFWEDLFNIFSLSSFFFASFNMFISNLQSIIWISYFTFISTNLESFFLLIKVSSFKVNPVYIQLVEFRNLNVNEKLYELKAGLGRVGANIQDCDGTVCGGEVCGEKGLCSLEKSGVGYSCNCTEPYTG